MPQSPQSPRSISDILTVSFDLYTASFTKVIGYSLIMFVCQALLIVFVINSLPDMSTMATNDPAVVIQQQAEAFEQATSGLTAVQFLFTLLACVLYCAMFYRIDNVANDRLDDFTEVLLPAAKKLPLLVLAGLLYGIAIVIGTFLLVIPGIILSVSLLFFGFLILFEDAGIFESLTTSHRLVWDNWWRTNIVFFIPLFVLSIVLSVVMFVIISSSGIVNAANDPAFLQNAAGTLTTFVIGIELLNAVITPYFLVLGYVQYQDLKLRNNM